MRKADVRKPKNPGSLASRTTIKNLLGLTKQGTYKATNRADFPAPIDVLDAKTPIWRLKDVEIYIESRHIDGNGKEEQGSSH